MAMSVGDLDVGIMRGSPGQVHTPTQEVGRPGVDGTSYVQLGRKAKQARITIVVDFVSVNLRQAFIDTLIGYEGTKVDITDAWAELHEDVFIRRVEIPEQGGLTFEKCFVGGINVSDGNDAYVLTAHVFCERTDVEAP